MSKTIRWERKDEGCWIAIRGVRVVRAIREGKVWRLDRTAMVCGAFLPWEPLTTATYTNGARARAALVVTKELG